MMNSEKPRKRPSADLGVVLTAEAMCQGITAYGLAMRSGLSQTVIRETLAGSRPRVDTLAAILRALGRPWGWLDEQGFAP